MNPSKVYSAIPKAHSHVLDSKLAASSVPHSSKHSVSSDSENSTHNKLASREPVNSRHTAHMDVRLLFVTFFGIAEDRAGNAVKILLTNNGHATSTGF